MDNLKIKKHGMAVTQKKADNFMLSPLFEHVEEVMNMEHPGNKTKHVGEEITAL